MLSQRQGSKSMPTCASLCTFLAMSWYSPPSCFSAQTWIPNGNSVLDCIFFTMATARLMVMLIFTIRRRLQCWTSHACVLTCTQQNIMVCSYIITRCWGCLLGLFNRSVYTHNIIYIYIHIYIYICNVRYKIVY